MTNLQQLIEGLKQKGKTDEEITTIVESLTKIAMVRASDAILKFASTSPEAADLETITDENAGQAKLAELYQKSTGQSFEELANAKLDEVAAEYAKEENKGA